MVTLDVAPDAATRNRIPDETAVQEEKQTNRIIVCRIGNADLISSIELTALGLAYLNPHTAKMSANVFIS